MAKTETPRLTTQEKRWQAEDDARTLATAKLIANDPKRLTAAKSAAARLAEAERKEVNVMSSVSKMKPGSSLRDGAAPRKKRAKPKPKETFNVFRRI